MALSEARAGLYSGDAAPGLFVLSASDKSAILLLEPGLGPPGYFCTGTHVADGWILTAKHCALGGGLFLHLPRTGMTLTASSIRPHESMDVLLAHFDVPAEAALGQIALWEDDISELWLGQRVMLAGYGEQQDGTTRELQFLTEAIAEITDEHVVVDGAGRSGACVGDSGGPILAVGNDGGARILGQLSVGHGSCLGKDKYVRADRIRSFAREVIGALSPRAADAACGSVTQEGICQANTAIHCSGRKVVAVPCAERTCSWSTRSTGYRCVDREESSCRGLSAQGLCLGSEARRCEAGRAVVQDCASCGMACVIHPKDGRAVCMP